MVAEQIKRMAKNRLATLRVDLPESVQIACATLRNQLAVRGLRWFASEFTVVFASPSVFKAVIMPTFPPVPAIDCVESKSQQESSGIQVFECSDVAGVKTGRYLRKDVEQWKWKHKRFPEHPNT